MRNQRLRDGLSIAALCVAALVCVQVGLIRAHRRGGDAAHQVEFEAWERARAADVAKVEAELERVERELERLRRALASANSEGAELEDALEATAAMRDALDQKVQALTSSLETERPFLDVHLAPSESPRTLAAIVENRGEQPLVIQESRGWLWVDGAPVDLDGSLAPSQLAPGTAADVFEFDPGTRSLEFVPESSAPVRGALCFVYGRMLQDEAAPWVEERWFEYRPSDGIAATVQRESWSLADGAVPCRLDEAPTPW